MPSLHVIDIGDAKNITELVCWDFHRPRAFGCARRRLRESSRKRSVEGHITLDFLHCLVDMPVQNRDRAKFLQVRKRLCTVVGPPAPLRITRTNWAVATA